MSKPPKSPREVDLLMERHLEELVNPGFAGFETRLLIGAEVKFHPEREWRFDYAIPELMLAIEIEGFGPRARGGIGRHQSPDGFREDCEKYNSAAALGWTVFRFPLEDVMQGR